jgi:hypothetical protein
MLACVAVLSVLSIPTEKAQKDNKFKDFLPLVNEIVTYTAAIFPAAMTNKHKHSHEFETLIQTNSATAKKGGNPFDQQMNTTQTIDMMMEMGNKAQLLVGYNPMQFLVELIGKDELVSTIDLVTKFAAEFPNSVTDDQVQDAEMMLLTLGVYGPDSEKNVKATEDFMKSLTPQQSSLLTSLQHQVLDKIVNVMMNPDGTPSKALIQETEKQLEQIEKSPVMQLLNTAFGTDESSSSSSSTSSESRIPVETLFQLL